MLRSGDHEPLASLVAWATSEDGVRGVLLVGSRARRHPVIDALSDYDVVLVVRDAQDYTSSDAWLNVFGVILVKLHERYQLLDSMVRTRLVEYEDGTRIDYSICTVGPVESEYRRVVNEFWWESIYVARNLAREEPLPASYSSECVIRFGCLLPMLEWYVQTMHGWNQPVGAHGRGLIRMLGDEDRDLLLRTLPVASWESLFVMAELFTCASGRVADDLGYSRSEIEVRVVRFLDEIG